VANILNTCDIYFYFLAAIFRKKILERPSAAESQCLFMLLRPIFAQWQAQFFCSFFYIYIRVTPIRRTLASLQKKEARATETAKKCSRILQALFFYLFSPTLLTRHVFT
jgi:hypothetical protein